MVYDAQQGVDAAAAELDYLLPNGNTVKYGKNQNIGDNECKTAALIGQLIAQNIKIKSDGNWGMLYVTNGETDESSEGEGEGESYDPGSHSTTVSYVNTFTIIDYSFS